MGKGKTKKKVYVDSQTNDEFVSELYFNARNGGIQGTQLEWWTEENWIIAVKGWVESLLNSKKVILAPKSGNKSIFPELMALRYSLNSKKRGKSNENI